MNNQVQLITYVDRLGRGDLAGLERLFSGPLADLFGGVHLLPFFDPIDGSDAGFDPVNHLAVDARLGDWNDVRALSQQRDLCADLIVNHISADSHQFQDYLNRGADSEYSGMFLELDSVFEGGATEEELERVYRPRPTPPYVTLNLADGTRQQFWTTFTSKQIDLDIHDPGTVRYLKTILTTLADNGVKLVRLDAVGYAVKTRGTSCFMTPETYAFIEEITGWCHELGMQVLAETHTHYGRQLETAKYVDWVYDFALPPLVLHSLFENSAGALKHWFSICPENVITVLDTHDGIGVMDVGTDEQDRRVPGLLEPRCIDSMVETIHANSRGASRRASRSDVGNLDLYQVNCAFYSALGGNDTDYLLARLIQFFAPGIPQVYYVGLLAGENDEKLFEARVNGREINRGYFSEADVAAALERPVVRNLCDMIRFRNSHPAFGGSFRCLPSDDTVLSIRREAGPDWAELHVDLASRTFRVSCSGVVAEVSSFDAFASEPGATRSR